MRWNYLYLFVDLYGLLSADDNTAYTLRLMCTSLNKSIIPTYWVPWTTLSWRNYAVCVKRKVSNFLALNILTKAITIDTKLIHDAFPYNHNYHKIQNAYKYSIRLAWGVFCPETNQLKMPYLKRCCYVFYALLLKFPTCEKFSRYCKEACHPYSILSFKII